MSLVHEDQLALPTPCGDWDVARLLAHLVAMPRNFVEMADGIEVDWMAEPEPVTVGWTADFRSLADDLIHFWHQVGEDADPRQVDWQTAELAVHTWDLARAIGHSPHLDPEVAERGLAFMSSALTPRTAGSPSARGAGRRRRPGLRPLAASPAAPPDPSLPVSPKRADPSLPAAHKQLTRHFLRQEGRVSAFWRTRGDSRWVSEDQKSAQPRSTIAATGPPRRGPGGPRRPTRRRPGHRSRRR